MVGAPSDDEMDMLDLAFGVTPTSRLGCQIRMSDALDGLTVQVPDDVYDPGHAANDPLWNRILEAMYAKWSPANRFRIQEIFQKYPGNLSSVYAALIRKHKPTSDVMHDMVHRIKSQHVEPSLQEPVHAGF